MLFRRKKHVSPVCPKTGKVVKANKKRRWLMWLLPITGLFALIWFLIRVIPKPSRAAYPCQRVLFPLASGFVVWITGVIASTLAYRRAKHLFRQSRYVVAGICFAVAVMAIWLPLNITSNNTSKAAFTPSEGANNPMGVAKGIHPGRVVWIHGADATSWNGSNGYWWDDNNTDQNTVDRMMGKSIRTLVSKPNDTNAWDTLFRHFNQTKGKGDVGYQTGEKIVIKINLNNKGNDLVRDLKAIDASPQMVRGLLRQLVYQAGVPQSAITVYDAKRPISTGDLLKDCVYNCCHPEFPDVNYKGGAGWKDEKDWNYPEDVVWVANAITYSVGYTNSRPRRMPQCVLDAEYMINMAILKRHNAVQAVTLCFKNHLGTIGFPQGLHNQGYWPGPPYNWPMGRYDLLVDIAGHESIGGKTILYMIDGLYGGNFYGAIPLKWTSAPFNNDWPSSIFVSQDPVAIDSVGLDFIRAEMTLFNNADNYLHEAAQADNPPSGTFYDPENDGTRLESLGVHEHWNNSTNKQYSRNLGTGNGVELVSIERLAGDFEPDYDVDMNDLAVLRAHWLQGSEVPLDGLVGYWPLDDDANDYSGSNNDGTVVGNPQWTVDGRFDGALILDGDGDYVTADVSDDVAAGDLTLSMWIKSNSTTTQQFIASFHTSSGDNKLMLGHAASSSVLQVHDGGWHNTGTIVIDGKWHHVVCVLDDPNDTVTVYVDNANVCSYSSTVSIAADDLFTLGQEYDGPSPSDFYNGYIDEVAIHNRILSDEEIHVTGDINNDDIVNFLDYAIFANNWLEGAE